MDRKARVEYLAGIVRWMVRRCGGVVARFKWSKSTASVYLLVLHPESLPKCVRVSDHKCKRPNGRLFSLSIYRLDRLGELAEFLAP